MLPIDGVEIRFVPAPHESARLAKVARLDHFSPSQLAAKLHSMLATEGNLFRASELLRQERRDRAAALMQQRKDRHAQRERERRAEQLQA